ncbi:hypothetical protein F4604DRAFT_1687323 [Suillus subluteus]|nr:hypothetical protein F4604DRAFT_1687323 [Suillus subluteus]
MGQEIEYKPQTDSHRPLFFHYHHRDLQPYTGRFTKYWEQGLGELEFGRTSASAVPTIPSHLSPSQGKFKFHDSPGLLLQPFNPAFSVNTEVYWPQSALAMPGSSQLLQPSKSFPEASQAGQDHFIPAPQSDLSQPTPSGSACQAQLYPPALMDPTYSWARPIPSQAMLLSQSQMLMGSGDFRSPTGPLPLPLAFRDSGDRSDLQRQSGSDGLPVHGGPSQGYNTLITQSLQYQSSAGGTNHPHAMMNPELQPSAGSYSTLHAQAQRQLLLGSFDSMVPSSIDDDMTQLLQHTRNKHPSSGLWTSKNTTPRNVPHVRRSKAATPGPDEIVIVSQVLLTQVQEEAKMEMISSIFEHELTQWAMDALNAVVTRYANRNYQLEVDRWWQKPDQTIEGHYHNAPPRLYGLTFDLSKSKAQMDLQRNTAITALLLNDLFLDGNLRVQMNTNQFQMFRVPLANPLIINFMEEMLSRQQYSRFIPFHVDNNRWEKCIGNTAYFIATICHSKLRKIGGIDAAHFLNQRDKDWYALSIGAIDSFTAQRLVLFNCFI